jgi:hypothetical protein
MTLDDFCNCPAPSRCTAVAADVSAAVRLMLVLLVHGQFRGSAAMNAGCRSTASAGRVTDWSSRSLQLTDSG